jgi:hypothetical protein
LHSHSQYLTGFVDGPFSMESISRTELLLLFFTRPDDDVVELPGVASLNM